jgi:hypothetical protein
MPWPNGAPRPLQPRHIPLSIDPQADASQRIQIRRQYMQRRIELVLSFDQLWRQGMSTDDRALAAKPH